MVPFKDFFNKQTAKKVLTAPWTLSQYLAEKQLDLEDYISELFDKALVKYGKKFSSKKRLSAGEARINLHKALKEMGYDVITAKEMDEGDAYPQSYHAREAPIGSKNATRREIGISRPGLRYNFPKLKMEKYLKRLFTLAHEAGHALQYDTPESMTNMDHERGKELAEDYLASNFDLTKMSNTEIRLIVRNLSLAYMEMLAWVRAVSQFIPEDLKPDLFKYAKQAYTTYMKAMPWGEYVNAPFIQAALNVLRHDLYEGVIMDGMILLENDNPHLGRLPSDRPIGTLMRVPIKEMGMFHGKPENLPDKKPYGFWMDKSGNFLPVSFENHIGGAYDIFDKANTWLTNNGFHEMDTYRKDLYQLLFNRGWIRLVFEGNTLFVDHPNDTQVSKHQKEMLGNMARKYNAKVEREENFRFFDEDDEDIPTKKTLFHVPRTFMGVFNTFNDMPPRSPYGFWIDRSGNFIPTESHVDTAVQMLTKANRWLAENGGEPIKFNPKSFSEPYKPLFNSGWIRVVSKNPTVMYETAPGNSATRHQLATLEEIKRKYGKAAIQQDYD